MQPGMALFGWNGVTGGVSGRLCRSGVMPQGAGMPQGSDRMLRAGCLPVKPVLLEQTTQSGIAAEAGIVWPDQGCGRCVRGYAVRGLLPQGSGMPRRFGWILRAGHRNGEDGMA